MQTTKKTKEEIEELKRNWCFDPIWDIEDTEGFEAHREELLIFSREQKATWEKGRAVNELANWKNASAFSYPPAVNYDGELCHYGEEGLSRREYYAIAAMQGLLANASLPFSADKIGEVAVKAADSLLDEIHKRGIPS